MQNVLIDDRRIWVDLYVEPFLIKHVIFSPELFFKLAISCKNKYKLVERR